MGNCCDGCELCGVECDGGTVVGGVSVFGVFGVMKLHFVFVYFIEWLPSTPNNTNTMIYPNYSVFETSSNAKSLPNGK